MNTSRWLFETSMPTERGCSMTRPCECGLCPPKRLFGFDDGTVGGAPSPRTVFRPRGGRAPTHLHPPELGAGLASRDTRGWGHDKKEGSPVSEMMVRFID